MSDHPTDYRCQCGGLRHKCDIERINDLEWEQGETIQHLKGQVHALEFNLRGVTDALGITGTNDSPADVVMELQAERDRYKAIAKFNHDTIKAMCDGGTCGLGGYCDDCPRVAP